MTKCFSKILLTRAAALAALSLFLISPILAQKRPLTHADYDGWKHIQNQTLSDDGRYLAYAVFPQEGDGELIVRDLRTGKEVRQNIGELPGPARPNNALPQTEESLPPPPGLAIKFTSDNSTVVISTFPRHAAAEAAKRDKRKPEDMPKGDLLVIKLATGEVFRAPSVRDFKIAEKASGYVAYVQVPVFDPAAAKVAAPETTQSEPPAPNGRRTRRVAVPTGELILRSLSDGTERKFPVVSEYLFTGDGKLLTYAASEKQAETNGVYVVSVGEKTEPTALLAGKGKYNKLAWDEDEVRLAFLSDRDDAAAAQPDFKLYSWDRHSPAAVEMVSGKVAGLPAKWVISDQAPVTLSKGGERIFFGTGPKPPPAATPDKTPADEKVSVDLWSWKDDYIQPMQKVRAGLERNRSYKATYDVKTKTFTQLADLSMQEVTPSENGRYLLGDDDRAYRRMQEYDERYQDVYVVDGQTGARKLAVKKLNGRMTWGPSGKFAVFYDGKDWMTISTPDAKLTNLTAKLGTRFGREDFDSPTLAPPYGLAGWTKDGRYVLIYDRFDIWRISPDGSSAIKITDGRGEHLAYRVVRFTYGNPADSWIDTSKAIIFRAENDDTHDSGFYRGSIENQKPVQLIFGPKNYATPIRARNAEVYVTSASTFSEFPDLLVADASFRDLKKVSDANPQMANIAWGTAELIKYTNRDGVKLEATLYKPANFDPKKKYPMLVYLYERLTQNVNNFIEPRPTNVISPSYYASNGYLVLEPDITYKIGYPGQSALGCVLPAVQEVVDRGFVDENAIGIQGHSWGGYQIAYMVTQTSRFRAAAPGAPVADMISAYDGIRWGPGIPRQFQYEHTQSRIGGTPWQYPMRYIENSPIFMADRITTPLLMIHNDADDAVPWYQGIELYLGLRRLNKEVYMFSYNGEPHNLRRRPNQKDYTVRLQQFFDYYLKGAPKPEWMETGIPFIEKQASVPTDGDR